MLNKKDQKFADENSELKKQLEKYRSALNELQLLNEIAVAAGNAADIDQMLNIMLQKTLRAISAEQGSIMLLTEDEKDPFKTLLRQENYSSLKPQYHISTSISGWVLKNEEPLLIRNLSKEKRFQADDLERKDIHSILCTPIWFEGKIIGIMSMVNKKDKTEFSDDDLTLLSIISVQAGQLIKNSQLQQEYLQKTKEAELSRWESEKLKELDTIKTNFFTNLSHEFRTPLTLILGPLEKLLEGKVKEDPSKQYRLIYNHASRLLRLVNQLLDLSSIDADKMKLKIGKYDIVSFMKNIIGSFQNFAEEKNIILNFNSSYEKIDGCFDRDKLEKIVSNLLSNAIKFNKENGFINIKLSEVKDINYTNLIIEVEDSGPGMSSEVLKNIFNRFYKAQNLSAAEGSGIGLALVKELIDLHFGEISVRSTIGKGTIFNSVLPVDEKFYLSKNIPVEKDFSFETASNDRVEREVAEKSNENLSEETASILIIEDNNDMRQFIKESIQPFYGIIESQDGEDGFRKAMEYMPELIISDLIMPKLNGYEFCEKIKNDERTSHIPVVMLTSKAEIHSRLKGFETGADDYLTKPFNNKELLIRIKNLIMQRKKLREKFRKEIILEPKDVAITSTDEKFLNRVMEIVELNLSNEKFSAEDFAAGVGMSKTHLNRKLNALADTSANEFVRTYRLKKAAKLLSGRSGNISEIAYEVGFGNPSYFAESFKKLFGYSPSEFLQNMDISGSNPS
jgi:signal transduction histidine kinase/DNA-binding response OmpR family regulator